MDQTAVGPFSGTNDEPPSSWLLIPSPVLGPSTWSPVGWALQSRGHEVRVAKSSMVSLQEKDHIGPWIDEMLATPRFDREEPVTVVAHAFACARTPLLVERLLDDGWPVDTMILVDGRFPDGRAALEVYPSLAGTIETMTRPDGFLPPWTCWWGSLFKSLLPDGELGRQVLSEAMPIPPGLFEQACAAPDLGDTVGRGFLTFGSWYLEANEQARQEGWLATVLAGDSMHQLLEPHRVTETLLSMVSDLRHSGN